MENKLKIQRYLKKYGRCWYNLDLMPFSVDKFDLIRDFFIQYNKTLPCNNTRFDENHARYELIKVLNNNTEKYFVLKSFLTRSVLTTSDFCDIKEVKFCFELKDGDFFEITDNAQEKFELYSKELLENELERKELIKVENGTVTFETEKENNEISW